MSLYLRFAAPLQSWAGIKTRGDLVNTYQVPTLSAVKGLSAAALGLPHGVTPEWFDDLTGLVRVDNPGVPYQELQTVTSRPESEEYLTRSQIMLGIKSKVSDGARSNFQFIPAEPASVDKTKSAKQTAVINRTYLGGAEFLIELQHPDPERLDELCKAFHDPIYSPYLGRKAFTPVFPFLLGIGDSGLLGLAPQAGDRELSVHKLQIKPTEWRDHAVTVPASHNKKRRMEWFAENCEITTNHS